MTYASSAWTAPHSKELNMDITDDQIVKIATSVDKFVHTLMDQNPMDIVDVSAIINSRLRALSMADDLIEDYDALMDHLNSQTILVSKTVH